jgi:hypothetical protein
MSDALPVVRSRNKFVSEVALIISGETYSRRWLAYVLSGLRVTCVSCSKKPTQKRKRDAREVSETGSADGAEAFQNGYELDGSDGADEVFC